MLTWAAERARLVVMAGLAFVVAAGLWTTLATGDLLMRPEIRGRGTIAYATLLFLMWWSMMMAMMLPSAAPAILSYDAIARKQPGGSRLALFALGYAAIWSTFSLAAMLLQIVTRDVFPLSGMMAVTSTSVGGLLLIAAGLYQFSPLKDACLRKCQSPFFYLAHHWQKGTAGAVRMGVAHGIHCLGCCWVLMLLLFYGGVMELYWIVGLALYVSAEKLIPDRVRFGQIAGSALMAWGAWVLLRSLA